MCVFEMERCSQAVRHYTLSTRLCIFLLNQFLNPTRSRRDPFFRAVLKSPTRHGESVTKPVVKTAHYLFCRGWDFGNFSVERLFFLLTSPPCYTPNWLHKSCLVWMRNVAVLSTAIFTLIYQFIKIHWCRIGERKWQHKSGLQHNDPNQLGIAENVMMNYVLVLVPLYIVIVLLYEWNPSFWHGLYLTKKSC